MNHSPKAVTFPIVLALALAGGNVFAALQIPSFQLSKSKPGCPQKLPKTASSS